MSDPAKDASENGWIAKHRAEYLEDGEAAHDWDSSALGGPGIRLAPALEPPAVA